MYSCVTCVASPNPYVYNSCDNSIAVYWHCFVHSAHFSHTNDVEAINTGTRVWVAYGRRVEFTALLCRIREWNGCRMQRFVSAAVRTAK